MTPFSVECRGYDELHEALRLRSERLGVSRLELDSRAGLPAGYASTLLAPVPVKALGKRSLGPILGALGLKIVVTEDAEMMARLAKRITPRTKEKTDASETMLPKRTKNRRGFRGVDASRVTNARRVLVLSDSKRKQIAKTAAKARWSKPRLVEIKQRGSK